MKITHSLFRWAAILLVASLIQACGTASVEQPNTTTGKVFDESAYVAALDLMKQEKYAEAAPKLDELARTDSERAGPYINLGIAYLKLEKLEEAKQALLIATERRSGNAIAWNELGLVYRKMGQFQNAREAYKKSIKKRARYGKAYLNLGVLCDIYLADLNCAMRNYKKYLEVGTDKAGDKNIQIWLADVTRRAGKGKAPEKNK